MKDVCTSCVSVIEAKYTSLKEALQQLKAEKLCKKSLHIIKRKKKYMDIHKGHATSPYPQKPSTNIQKFGQNFGPPSFPSLCGHHRRMNLINTWLFPQQWSKVCCGAAK